LQQTAVHIIRNIPEATPPIIINVCPVDFDTPERNSPRPIGKRHAISPSKIQGRIGLHIFQQFPHETIHLAVSRFILGKLKIKTNYFSIFYKPFKKLK